MKDSLGYLASVYTLYADGLDAAFEAAARIGARLLRSGIFVYSPIVHLHSMARFGRLDPLDLTLFYPHNTVMMARCDTLIVARMEGWTKSSGIAGEVEFFTKADKPIFDLDPNTLSMTKRLVAA